MLVLTRKCNESVIVGDRIVSVTVLEINGANVRLGFEAASGIAVHRSEVWAKLAATARSPAAHAHVQEGNGYGSQQST